MSNTFNNLGKLITDTLVINSLTSGTSINNLGIDSNGNVVSAITYTDGTTITGDGSIDSPLTFIGGTNSGNQLLTGGASYSNSGLTFDVSQLTYILGGVFYGPTTATTVTLSSGDSVNQRFDAIVVDENQVVSVIEGTPSTPPLTPSISEDYVLIQYVFIDVGATIPLVTTEYVYREGSTPDWTGSVAGTNNTADFTYTGITPFQGSECTLASIGKYGYQNGVRWSTGTPVDRNNYVVLSFRIYLTTDLIAAGKDRFYIFAYSDNTPVSGDYLGYVLASNYFNMSLTNQWQLVNIPTGLFSQNLTNTTIGFLNFTLWPNLAGNASVDFALDDIKLQTGYAPSLNNPTIDILENGTTIGDTPKLNFVNGNNTSVSVSDDTLNNKIDVQIDSSFTGNTSGDCITDLFVSNIHSCSPLNINPLDEGNVYFGSTSGVTIDITNNRVGIGTSSPQYSLQILGANSTFYYDPTSVGGRFNISGNTQLPRYDISIAPYLTKPTTGGSIGMRAWNDVSSPGYGDVGDMFLYAGNETNGLNILNPSGTNTDDYIRFYAGQNANGTTSDIHIQGSGSTKGYVGIGTETPTEKLHVNSGDILVENTSGKFLTDIENSTGPLVLISGGTSDLPRFGAITPSSDSITMGVRGSSDVSYPGYGNQGDSFIYSSNPNNGINIISSQGTGTDDYIRFYAGQNANGTTPDLYIQGSGSTRGNIGINNDSPTSKLDIVGANGYEQLRLRNSYTPSSSGDTNGNIGDIAWDTTYLYIKTGTGWGRISLDYVF